MRNQTRERIIALLLALIMVFSMTACSQTEEETPLPPRQNTLAPVKPSDTPTATAPTTPTTPEPAPSIPASPESPIGTEDTYWIAYEWYSDDGEGAEGPHKLDPDKWALDLIVRANGTARFRDVHDGLYLMDDADLYLTWEKEDDGTISFYNEIYQYPILQGTWENDIFSVDYRGTSLSMKRSPMPENAGELYHPAELAGTWLMVSGETEGWEWNAMPGELESLVFKTVSTAMDVTLAADHENRSHYGELGDARYGQELTILDEPLYEGCGNEAWSVRIGPESPLDANGYPTQTEFHVTMLEQDKLLMQRYYTLDGYPAVSYQTFRRMPEHRTWWDVQAQELEDTSWICTGYLAADGTEYPMPPYLEDFYLYLGIDAECWVGRMDKGSNAYTDTQGTWMLANGGVLLLQGEGYESLEGYCPEFWYGGAVSGYTYETEDGFIEGYEMHLHDGEGTLKLTLQGYG